MLSCLRWISLNPFLSCLEAPNPLGFYHRTTKEISQKKKACVWLTPSVPSHLHPRYRRERRRPPSQHRRRHPRLSQVAQSNKQPHSFSQILKRTRTSTRTTRIVLQIKRKERKMEVGFVGLLRAAWVASILPILLAAIPSSRLTNLRQFLLLFSGRGKTLKTSSHRFTVPQKYFTHFYVVAVLSTSILLLTTWIYAHETAPLLSDSAFLSNIGSYFTRGSNIFHIHKSRSSLMKETYRAWTSLFLLLLMEFQALRRLYESLYVFNYSPTARMHILGYLTGLFFYTAAPLSFCADIAPDAFKYIANQIIKAIVRGKTQIPDVEFQWLEYVIPLTKLGWRQWIGALIFLWGSFHQYRCHAILGELREGKEKADDYVIPHGDWFELVSSPHYLAEMVIYGGIVVASGGTDLTVWLLYGFVVANLVLAAAETHRWYRRKFENYPSNRYAVIPYVY